MKTVLPALIAIIAIFALPSCEQQQAQIEIEDGKRYSITFGKPDSRGITGKLYNVKGGYRVEKVDRPWDRQRKYFIPYHSVSVISWSE
tara:strand:+ start:332 stop:595 length:264 start_codon:yes stop_codon:yes gene_type:complete